VCVTQLLSGCLSVSRLTRETTAAGWLGHVGWGCGVQCTVHTAAVNSVDNWRRKSGTAANTASAPLAHTHTHTHTHTGLAAVALPLLVSQQTTADTRGTAAIDCSARHSAHHQARPGRQTIYSSAGVGRERRGWSCAEGTASRPPRYRSSVGQPLRSAK